MIVIDCEQGSDEWHALRAGIPTASEFNKILTGGGKKSTQASDYMDTLLAEWVVGGPIERFTNKWMERGKEMEPTAIASYELTHDVDVRRVGLILSDDRMMGCSPDGLVGSDGGLELKCVAGQTQIKRYRADALPGEYKPQVQGTLMITDREWWDFMSYCPGMTPFVTRVERDLSYIMTLRAALAEFTGKMVAERHKLRERGYGPKE